MKKGTAKKTKNEEKQKRKRKTAANKSQMTFFKGNQFVIFKVKQSALKLIKICVQEIYIIE